MEMRPETAGTRLAHEKEGEILLHIFGGRTLAYILYMKAATTISLF
jgi:hypothetical protein